MKCIFLNVKENKEPKILDIKEELNIFYDKIQCEIIDIVKRQIGQEYYNIICDDEALLKKNNIASALDICGFPNLYGNLIITGKVDENGNLTSLTNNDIDNVLQNIKTSWVYDVNKKICQKNYILSNVKI